MMINWDFPSGKLTYNYGKSPFYGNIHYKWTFSITMLDYQNVTYHEKVQFEHETRAFQP